MQKLSGVVISYNEEEKIEAALRSLDQVCDEIVVVDSLSSDGTADICRRFADRVIKRPWQGYREQKQYATDQATHEWVLSLDADEELSPELSREISGWKESTPVCDGYSIPRTTLFMGRWIRHTTWYPDCQLRLFKRTAGRWVGGRLHESFQVQGNPGRLKGHIRHYTYTTISEFLQQLDRFSTLAAEDYLERGKKANPIHLTLYPPAIFIKNYLLRLGFLDGLPGLVVSVLAATSVFFKYLKLWELHKSRSE